ncbi:hypothetical protein TruAng_006031 [Truncatella angustata]|nr:hypothetical protein TruAng_006031 [Truncatella angustata]
MNCSHSDHSASNINSSQLGIQHDPARLQNDVAASPPQYESLDLNDRIGLSGLENTRHGRKGSREPQYTISKEHNWKPWRIRSPALIGFIVFSLGLAITLEILAQKGQRYGALARSSSVDDISDLARLAALYLPTVAAVLYGFFFACVDLDLKRIQPWVELAKSEGTTATNSLLLDYAFDFVAFVPFTAARRRHWPVFYAGTVMMIIFWAITPLQSSIFGPGSTTLTHSATISYPEMLIPIRQQAAVMDVSIFNGAFATTWLSQIYPSSTTADSATLPIHAIQSPDGGTNISATGWTWQLTTELNCWPAIEGNLTWDNGQGCSVSRSFAVSMEGTLNMITNRYIGYYDNALVDFSLGSKTCGSNFKHQFFAVNAFNSTTGGTPKDAKINALFCEPTYYKRNITVSISQETLKPDFSMITSQGPKLVLSDDEFNRTAFEYLIGTGVPSVDLPRDITDSENIEPYYQVKRRDERISWPIQAMSGLVIGSRNYTGEELLDSAALIDACSAAQKAMFSVAVAKLLSNGSGTQPGTITYTVHGILVSRPISAVVEVLLVVTATLVGLTWLHCRKMQTKLSEDPSTLAKVMKIAQRNSALTAQFSRMDQMNDEDLIKAFEPMQFKTEYDNTIVSMMGK